MDIYKYAESINYNADYYDQHTGYIFHIQEYGRCLKFGLPTTGIKVSDNSGNLIGIARRTDE